jgi:hypothetical protein
VLTVVVMAMPVTKPQDHTRATIVVGAAVIAIDTTTTAHRSAAPKMAMPPTPTRAPPAASMIGVRFGNERLFRDGAFA